MQREVLLAQLFDAQQMDTVAQLAEVAHDFNNLLMAVQGSLALLAKHLPEDPECRRLLQNGHPGDCSQRHYIGRRACWPFPAAASSSLASTRRIGEVVSGMEALLKHAVGFGIDLICRFPRTLPPAFVDANQLELALLNLALIARSAMPGGGRLTISASDVAKDYDAAASPLPPGDYVRPLRSSLAG